MARKHINWTLWNAICAWSLLPIFKFTIQKKGFLWTCQRFHGAPFTELPRRTEPITEQSISLAESIQKSVLQAGRFWPKKRNNCLQRASVTCFMIRSKKIPCIIKLGIRGNEPKTAEFAHAWIEIEGKPIGESATSLKIYHPFTLN